MIWKIELSLQVRRLVLFVRILWGWPLFIIMLTDLWLLRVDLYLLVY